MHINVGEFLAQHSLCGLSSDIPCNMNVQLQLPSNSSHGVRKHQVAVA